MNGTMAMPVNPGTIMAAPVFNPNVKDSRWLTLEVCREYTRNKCTRSDQECKFAHPPPHVEVQNGRVTCCFDSIKGKCQRKDPPCKYLHPPQHLKEQLLQNGRNNLILKNLQIQTLALGGMPPQVVPGMVPAVAFESNGKMPYPLTSGHMLSQYGQLALPPYMMAQPNFNPYMNSAAMGLVPESLPVSVSSAAGSPHQVHTGAMQPSSAMTQKVARADRLEVCREFQRGTCSRQQTECRYAHPPESVTVDSTDNHITVCMDFLKGKCSRESCRYFHPPPHLQNQLKAVQQRANAAATNAVAQSQTLGINQIPGMVPIVKRPATLDGKTGIPMYQPTNNHAYQQALAAMQLQQQYIPAVSIAGHPPGMPRF